MGEDRNNSKIREERKGVEIVGMEMDGLVRAPEGSTKNRAIEEGKIGGKEVDRNRGRINGEIGNVGRYLCNHPGAGI